MHKASFTFEDHSLGGILDKKPSQLTVIVFVGETLYLAQVRGIEKLLACFDRVFVLNGVS